MSTSDSHSLRRRHLRRYARVAAAVIAAWSLVAWAAAEALVVRPELAQADALVVLAGSATYRERAARAAELFAEGRAPLILLTNDGQQSGWSAAEQRNPFFYERTADELSGRGVPRERVLVVARTVTSTHDEALRVREFAEANGLRSVIAVTAPYQTRRALWTLRRVLRGSGVAVGVDAPPPGLQSPRPAVWWLRPLGWRLIPGEYFKLIYYRAHY